MLTLLVLLDGIGDGKGLFEQNVWDFQGRSVSRCTQATGTSSDYCNLILFSHLKYHLRSEANFFIAREQNVLSVLLTLLDANESCYPLTAEHSIVTQDNRLISCKYQPKASDRGDILA
jgi:hypothetical protein